MAFTAPSKFSVPLTLIVPSLYLAFCACVLPAQDPEGPRLRKAADAVLQLEDVEARGHVDVVFRYGDWLLAHGPKKEALRYLQAGLKIYAWRLDQQLKLARVLYELGDKEGGARAAELVSARGEDDSLVLEARALLGQSIPETKIVPLDATSDAVPTLVLLPLGDVDVLLLTELADTLAKKLGIDVILRQVEWTMPKPGRDPYADYVESIRSDLKRRRDDKNLNKALEKLKLKPADMDSDEKLLAVARTRTELAEDPEAALQFDETLRLTALRRQWDAAALLEQIESKTRGFRKKGVAYVAVTRCDLYAADYNYLFARAAGETGVLSYARFRAAFNDESPDRRRLLQRTLKQALASAGHVFGLARCTNPTCARVFPISLEEHDAKSDDACAACKAGFERAFKAVR